MDDNEIVRLFTERSEEAIAAAMKKYKTYCMRIAVNILYSREDAEECVNDVFLKAWETIPPHDPENFQAFLGKITRNIAINRHRDQRAGKRGSGDTTLVFEELSAVISDSTNIENEAERRELLGEISAFLKRLPERKRNIFIARYWYCESIRGIAEKFSVSESNVSVILNRTRQKLREHLLKRGF
ncbi:MAG: sigma-70 family RNA polymerase sigma factor [Oscillospiraceae bacterium]|nr:sigma-70 family RNA polymerase sigma factor [Oscillospiraceae bacterium]